MPRRPSFLAPWVACIAIVVSALATALTFPPWGLRPLAFVCLVPLLLAIRSGGLLRALLLSGAWCVLFATAIASVFPVSVARYYEQPLWFGFVVAALAFVLMAAVYYMAFAAADRLLVRRLGVATPLLVAAAWTAAELGRGRLLTGSAFFIGNPWGLLGYTHASGPLAQVASVAGVYGIGFAIVAVNAGLAGLLGAWRRPGARATAAWGMLLSVLPAAAAAVGGLWVLGAAPAPETLPGTLPVAIVQGDVSIDRAWRSDFHGKNLDVYLGLTRLALQGPRETGAETPRLIVWPESAMNFFLEGEPRYRDAIAAVLGDSGALLLAGGPGWAAGGSPSDTFNSVFAIRAGATELPRYDKQYLIPFSEYFPASSSDWMRRRLEGARTFSPGAVRPKPLDTPLGPAGILVCNEAMLPEVARERVRAGAQILVSPSNDSWIPGRAFAEHMLAVVGLRAVEQRRYLLRASTSGPSAVVDPWGRVVSRTAPGVRAVLQGHAAPLRRMTVYGRFGDVFALGCVAATLVGCVRARRRDRRGRAWTGNTSLSVRPGRASASPIRGSRRSLRAPNESIDRSR